MEAVTVKDLRISYQETGAFSIKRNLLHPMRKEKRFEAVRGLSFSVDEGEVFGIVGKNGSGKSTMLRAVANIFTPDFGTIDLHGRTVSLLSIGVGFYGNLTGRKNIELSGLLLGFSKKQIESRMDEIIAFSEVGEFIDKPVRTYSSGMYSKLAFAITVCLETDVMLIDEILSVGDEHFKRKSYEKIKEMISGRDKTVIIVSHSLSMLDELCNRILWMHEGKAVKIGKTADVLPDYRRFMSKGGN